MSGVWWLESSTPLFLMKLSRWGICSRSEGTSVEPSRAGSRWKCVLSKMMVTTCLMFPFGEFSWQPPAGGAGAGTLAGAGAAACVGITGVMAKNPAVAAASICRSQLRVLCRLAVVLERLGYVRLNFTEVSFRCVVGIRAGGAEAIWLNYALRRRLALLVQEISVNPYARRAYTFSCIREGYEGRSIGPSHAAPLISASSGGGVASTPSDPKSE